MKYLGSLLALLLCALFFCPLAPAASQPPVTPPSGELRGMLVYTRHNTDFPSRPGLTAQELRQEAQRLAEIARQSGFTSLVFEAVPAADAMYRSRVFPASAAFAPREGAFTTIDPLQIVIEAAKAQGLQVYAMVTPYYAGDREALHSKASPVLRYPKSVLTAGKDRYLSPSDGTVQALYAQAAAELLKNYDLNGVFLSADRLPGTSGDWAGLRQLAAEILQTTGQPAGILLEGDHPDSTLLDFAAAGYRDGLFSLVLPLLRQAGAEYTRSLALWQEALPAAALASGNIAEQIGAVSASGECYGPLELNYQLIAGRAAGLAGTVCSGYRALQNPLCYDATVRELASVLNYDYIPPVSLAIPTWFAVTRPSQPLTTTYARYFITGTSRPDQPVYIDGQEMDDRAANGAFGWLVPLQMGENHFTITQGDQSRMVTITRVGNTVGKISAITPSTAYPAYGDLLFAQQGSVELSCTAPAGAAVTAQVAGETVALEQAASAEPGMPATYRGTMPLPGSYPAGETVCLGPVTYTLEYEGNLSSVQSGGELYVAGEGAQPSVQVSAFWGSVLEQAGMLGVYRTVLKQGANDYVAGVTGRYYRLESGGYLDKAEATVNTGAVELTNRVAKVTVSAKEGAETFAFQGSLHPAYHVEVTEEGIALTLFHTTLEEGALPAESGLFSAVSAQASEGNTRIFFHLREGKRLWGYDLNCEGGVLQFYCKEAPSLSGDPLRPLAGVHILLDPGHGGYDSGALGVAGETGPMEKQLNFAAAAITKTRLESLGATVTLTREEDTFVSLDDRLAANEQQQPDFFLAMHHNSTAETVDSAGISGVEVYYHTSLSEAYAEQLLWQVAGETGRKANWCNQDYYRVTRSPVAPSALLEIGYLPNPSEYMQVCDLQNIYRTACGVSQALLESLKA